MRLLVVSGIFPPDIGGPATHATEIRAELMARGHDVEVLSLTDAPDAEIGERIVRFPRAGGWLRRDLKTFAWLVRNARRFDVIYATGLGPVAVAAGRLSRTPVILKIVADAAWERGSRLGLTRESFERFQESTAGSPRLRAMRWLRNWSARHATAVVSPSEHLARSIRRWAPESLVAVVPNGARSASVERPRVDRPADSSLDLLFVGRLVDVKRVDVLVRAIACSEAARLEIVGDGPELDSLETLVAELGMEGRVSFAGALAHGEVLRRVAAADALVLASSHEGLPHVVLEALVSGTPVVTSRAGGVEEVVTDEIDGLVVSDATPEGFAVAFDRLARDPVLLGRLRDGAAATGREWTFDRCADRLEELMVSNAKRPRVVVVARASFSVPPTGDEVQKYELHRRHIRTVIVCPATRAGIRRPAGATVVGLPPLRTPALGSAVFYTVAPVVALGIAAGRRRTAISCQSPYEAFGVTVLRTLLPRRLRPPVQIELHGDWRTATRFYGSPRRRWLSGAADKVAAWSLRHADRVRPVSEYLEALAREAGYDGPVDRFIAFSDYSTFLEQPVVSLPTTPHALFVGVLEPHKGLDVLLDAWPEVLRAVPGARLTIVGAGSLESEMMRRLADHEVGRTVRMLAPMSRPELRCLVDEASCLVLPSRSEGLGRVLIEAMARARPIVASRVGGIVELVVDGSTGRLVAAEDRLALAEALIEVLSDRTRAESMGAESRRRAIARDPLREYESGIERMAEWIRAS